MLLKLDNTSGRKTLQIFHTFMQWLVVNKLFQEKKIITTKRMDPREHTDWAVLEVATSYLHGKYGVEIRIWSLNRDNTHSWVRISHGSNRFVMNLDNNDTEIQEVVLDEYVSKLDTKDFACRSKAQARPQGWELVGSSPRTVPIGRRTWTDVEPGEYSFSDHEVSKKCNVSPSSITICASRRWSSAFLENQRTSSETFPAFPLLVW